MCNLYKLKRTTAEVADLFRVRAAGALNHAEDVYPGYTGLVVAGGAVRAMTWGFPLSLTGAKGSEAQAPPGQQCPVRQAWQPLLAPLGGRPDAALPDSPQRLC